MDLRYYQREAIESIYHTLRTTTHNPLVVIPTGGGKTPVIGSVVNDTVTQWNGRVCVLAHVKELVAQAEKTALSVNPSLDVGVYSAGLRKRQLNNKVVCASIQSVYKRGGDLGRFDLIMVDEAHLIPPKDQGMFRTFIDTVKVVNPRVRFIGLTATPYRLGQGLIYGDDLLFQDISYEIGVKRLIVDGYLSPLISKRVVECDASNLKISKGDFAENEMSDLMLSNVEPAIAEVLSYTQDRHSVLIFCAGIDHAFEVAERLHLAGEKVGILTNETSPSERDELILQFKRREIKYLVNVSVLTTGFDAPNVDCVVLMRATLSPGLYYQMVGRGFRLFDGKTNCLILDFGGNVERHGPVDQIEIKDRIKRKGGAKGEAPTKVCPQCLSVVLASFQSCPDCEHQFLSLKQKHEATSSEHAVVSDDSQAPSTTQYVVTQTTYARHQNRKDPSKPPTLRVDYHYGSGPRDSISEWICLEHEPGGFAHRKACEWWQRRSSLQVPSTIEEAVALGNAGELPVTYAVDVQRGGKDDFPRIVRYEMGKFPANQDESWRQAEEDKEFEEAAASTWTQSSFLNDEDVPF